MFVAGFFWAYMKMSLNSALKNFPKRILYISMKTYTTSTFQLCRPNLILSYHSNLQDNVFPLSVLDLDLFFKRL